MELGSSYISEDSLSVPNLPHANLSEEDLPLCVLPSVPCTCCSPIATENESEQSREQLRRVLEQVNCLLWEADVLEQPDEGGEHMRGDDERGTVLYWDLTVVNQSESEVPSWLPVAREQGETVADAWMRSRDPEDQIAAGKVARDALLTGKPRYVQTFRHRMADGSIRWMFEDVRIEKVAGDRIGTCDGNGRPLRRWRLTGVVTDVTERIQAEEQQRALARQLGQVTEQANCLLWQAEVKEVWPVPPGDIALDPIRGTAALWQYLEAMHETEVLRWLPIERGENESFSQAWNRARQPDDFLECRIRCREALASGADRYTQVFRTQVQDGTFRWLQEDVRVEEREPSEERCPTGERLRRWRLTGVVIDITELKAAAEALWWRANHDSLTGLPNRQWLRERMQNDLQRLLPQFVNLTEASGGLFLLDLDGFKYVNDSLGHDAGDQFLQVAAARLTATVQAEVTRYGKDIAVARLGGDEFVIWVPEFTGNGSSDAVAIAECVLRALSQSARIELPIASLREVLMTSSMGIALVPSDGVDVESLLKRADTALYQAKETGRGRYRFHTRERSIAVADRLLMETRLRRAVREGDFTLYYQAQVDLATSEWVAVEALVRWIDAELGTVPPNVFIPLAEEIGLIHRLGEWVLETACRQAAQWRRTIHPALRVCVNLSVLQMVEAGMVDVITTVLDKTGLPGEALELELTETALFRSGEQGATAFLRDIRERGIRLAIDDFGTGYSSLSYLRSVPVDLVKIDRGFILDVVYNRQTRAIVAAIIDLAHALGIKVTAEGVENESQRAVLAALECDIIQGFLYSRPVAAKKMATLLQAERPSVS